MCFGNRFIKCISVIYMHANGGLYEKNKDA